MIQNTSQQDVVIPSGSRSRVLWRWILAGVSVCAAVVVMVYPRLQQWQSSSLSVPLEKLRLATVEYSDITRDVSVQGKIVAAVKPMLFSPASGRVTLQVRAGDSVERGDLLAEVHSPELSSEYKQEQSSLESLRSEVNRQGIQTRTERLALKQQLDIAKVELVAAKREMRRADIAFSNKVISLQDHEKAGDDLYRAELEFSHRKEENLLRFERLELELEIRNHELNRQQLRVDELLRRVQALAIVSPVIGVVGNLEVNEKDAVGQYQALLSVVDLSAYEVEMDVPENFADDLSVGIDVEIRKNDIRFSGVIASISPEVEGGQVKCRVRFLGPGPEGLRQNQRVSARILFETRQNVLTVAKGSFLQSLGGRVAYVVGGNMASRRSIQTGVSNLSRVEIVSGLSSGDSIVVSGTSFFDDQDQVLLID